MKNILVIEDNIDNMDLVEAMIEDNFIVLKAFDGKAGLEKAIEKKPDLILLDISLPEMDGTEVIKEIRKNESIKNTPIIALTAHAMIGDKEKYINLGFNNYMSKPIIDEDDLLDIIGELLNN